MIKVKRGSTKKWTEGSGIVLEPGQPGYDKTKHKLKIGDGEKTWSDLPYTSGLFAEEILSSEEAASKRFNADNEDTTIITYGTAAPNKDTVGQIYLQQYDEPEVDYVIDAGVNGVWSYQKWAHGFARCWCRVAYTTAIQASLEDTGFYQSESNLGAINYPFAFTAAPVETVTVQSPGYIVWLSGKRTNTETTTGTYALVGQNNSTASYYISIQVEGFWK